MQHTIAQSVPVGVRDWVIGQAVSGGHDWQRTLAFPVLANNNGYLRFNIEGRETQGCLARNTPFFQHYAEFIQDRLLELHVDSTSLPLVRKRLPFPTAREGTSGSSLIFWKRMSHSVIKKMGRVDAYNESESPSAIETGFRES
ncbi:MAG: hypothetical protein ACU84H_15425 [Gammaproteobacteria bacterium]